MFSTGTVNYGEAFRNSPDLIQFPYPKQQFVEMVLSNFTSVLKVLGFIPFNKSRVGLKYQRRHVVVQDPFEELTVVEERGKLKSTNFAKIPKIMYSSMLRIGHNPPMLNCYGMAIRMSLNLMA
uniref:Uncharacterized protein n=1 Tax=Solanum lycopersicum TaxID=4081 RepID=A0A3Q7IXD7_SOLLC